jgi:pSer/pThr/pTyr-binding forkhead associated (FHA) protein
MFLLVNGRRVEMRGEIVRIGRAPENDVVIDDRRVSRRHLELRRRADFGDYMVFDVGSSSGTWLNGYCIRQCALEPGDLISLGGCEIRVG